MSNQGQKQEVAAEPEFLSTTTLSGLDLAHAELSQWLSYTVHRADRDIARRFLADFGYNQSIPPVAMSMLMLISSTPGLDQQEIATALEMDKANAARLIRQLDQSGWLLRRQQVADHRKQGVYLTPQGVFEFSKLKRNMRKFEQELSEVFNEQEFEILLQLLRRLHLHAKRKV